MMKVKVHYKDILAETEKAVLFLVSEQEVWFPRSRFGWGKGSYIVCDDDFADLKGVSYSNLYHTPPIIKPIVNQEACDELRFNPIGGD
jgi:hypothetical protein